MVAGLLLAASLAQPEVRPFEEADALLAQTALRSITPSKTWVSGWDRDPRNEVAREKAGHATWKLDPAIEKEVLRLSADLEAKPPSSGSDPRVKRISELAAKLSPPGEKELQAALAKQERYDQETRRWVKTSGYEAIPTWKGKIVMRLDLPIPRSASGGRAEIASVVEWTAPNRFWGATAGRLLWTGGYTVRVESRPVGESDASLPRGFLIPPRQVVRPGKNFSQMHLGREGWYIKFTPVGVEVEGRRFTVPLPSLSNLLLNGHLLDSIQTSADVGDLIAGADRAILPGAALLGFPSDLTSRSQSGGAEGTLANGGRFRIAWRFAPS